MQDDWTQLEFQKGNKMKIMSFAEINDLENGQQISALKGTVKKVFDQITDVGQYGQWWLQSFIMTDEHANEIRCTWSGEDTVNNLEGRTVLIEAGRDKKDQLAGIKKEIKKKGDKTYESVKLDDRCKIQTDNGKPIPKSDAAPFPDGDPANYGDGSPDWPEATPVKTEQKRPSTLDERQRAIIRQHSQSMSLEVLKLKVALNELTVVDLTPSKLKALADYFDNDCFTAAQV
jgi:hypothetical protein